jgi:hypothetical protein
MILELPIECVNAIIYGPKTKATDIKKINHFAKKSKITCYQMHIGRSSMRSFFVNQKQQSFVFDHKKLLRSQNICADCYEPLEKDSGERCHWCAVSEVDKQSAAFRNPMRRLAQLGLLGHYLKSGSKS